MSDINYFLERLHLDVIINKTFKNLIQKTIELTEKLEIMESRSSNITKLLKYQ